jgi:hypothetical protein
LNRRFETGDRNRGPVVRSRSVGLGAPIPTGCGASPIVDKAASRTTARIYGVPIIGDVDEHRVYAGLRRGAVVVAQDAAEAFGRAIGAAESTFSLAGAATAVSNRLSRPWWLRSRS